MIAGLKPYPVMKDSKVEWLGKIPDHWTEKRAKYFYREADERSTTGEEELLSVSHKTGVTPRKQSVTMFMAESTVGYKLCRPNDLAANTMWVFMGALGVSQQVVLVSPSYGVYRPIRPGDLLPEYVDRLLRVDGYKAEYMCRSTGINSSRLRLYPDDFLRIPIVCPPISEQTAIVRYLDHVDRRVRRLVRAKRKLIALLTEQKKVIIQRAVTRGLDPNVPLKESGVELLGEVPAHWDVVQLGRIGTFSKGRGGSKEDEVPEGIPCVRYGDLYMRHRFFVEETKACVADDRAADYTPIQYGDVLFAGSGETIEEIGKSAVNLLTEPACCGGDVIIFRPSISVDARFLGLSSDCPHAAYQKSCMGRGITVMHIYGDELKYLSIALPPPSEQAAIVDYLDQATADIDAAITRASNEINLLTEYRTRLTADVVTGKLDVREAAAVLPEVDPLAADDEPDTLDAGSEPDLDELDAIPEEAEV